MLTTKSSTFFLPGIILSWEYLSVITAKREHIFLRQKNRSVIDRQIEAWRNDRKQNKYIEEIKTPL